MHVSGWNIVFQIVNFLVLAFLLQRYLWKPVAATIDQRKKEVDEAMADAAASAAAAEQSKKHYEAKLGESEAERARVRREAEAEMAEERARALAKLRAEVADEAEAARHALDEERRAAADEVTREAVELAVDVSRRLLAEVRSSVVAEAFLERICERLDALSPAELAALRADLGERTPLYVATAPALEPAARAHFAARLAKRLGMGATLEFVADDTLIAGAELRFPHARVGHSFQHGLEAAHKELVENVDAR